MRDVLRKVLPSSVGTLLHVGAGALALDLYSDFDIRQLVLVEGDPDACSQLERAAKRTERDVLVLGRAVTPTPGPALWHRYSVRSLNGPVSAEAAKAVYPRLRLWSTLPCEGTGLFAMLEELSLRTDDQHPNVLVLDTPGQLLQLVRSAGDNLRRFSVVVCAGYESEVSTAGDDGAGVRNILAAAGYRDADDALPLTDGVWGIDAWRSDIEREELRSLRQAVAEATARADKAAQAREALSEQLTRLEEEARAHQQALQRRIEALTNERDECVNCQKQLRQDRDSLSSKLEAVTAEFSRAAAESAQRDAARMEVEKKSNWQEEQMQLLRDQLDRQRQQLDAALAECSQFKAKTETLDQELVNARAEVKAARDAASRMEQEGRVKMGALEDEIAQLRLRQRLLDEEVIKAEGQIELIKDVLLREASL